MASFKELTGAFMKVSQEATAAFANFNFDFSLVKLDAPKEYLGLGEALSTRRKKTAEDGPLHVTARKLGALFQSVTPDVPNLIRAYGLRASEIAGLPEVNPREAASQRGLFADHVGADGTTIWAAATSGGATVTIHLLACMLARIWNREQAVSIWSELVAERKILLHELTAGAAAINISDLTASRVELSRSQLDEWDASARAWLQSADVAKRLQQTQFRLVMDNIPLPVSDQDTPYKSVIDAWTVAMRALEALINGEPQRVDNGAVLLGLSAWHLYPDIALGGTNQLVKQNDDLITPGGVITVGLKGKDDYTDGVFWSLPLAHARYYGNPLRTTQHAGIGESRVGFDEFVFVAMGSVLSGWTNFSSDLGVSLDSRLNLFRVLAKAVRSEAAGPLGPLGIYNSKRFGWLYLFDAAVDEYVRSTDVYKQQITRLIAFGQRRCSKLLADPDRGAVAPFPVFGLTAFSDVLLAFDEDSEARVKFLHNWAVRELPEAVRNETVIRYYPPRSSIARCTKISGSVNSFPSKRSRYWGIRDVAALHWTNDDNARLNQDERHVYISHEPGSEPSPYQLLIGRPELAALYVPISGGPEIPRSIMGLSNMSVRQLVRCIEEGDLQEAHIATMLYLLDKNDFPGGYVDSLKAIETANNLYCKLSGAKVHLGVASKLVGGSGWWEAFSSLGCWTLQTALSCIAYFETGGFDISPSYLADRTFAICYASSIFVAGALLRDPLDDNPEVPVERIVGNVGEPGLVILITPPDVKTREVELSSWRMVAHEPFDGTARTNFDRTSFHLSFTGYKLPIDNNRRSHRETPAYFLETATSIYDRGEWVADVDIIQAAQKWQRVPECTCHDHEQKDIHPTQSPFVAVDTWLELLDPPVQNAVIRAHKNPVGRLATAALAGRLSTWVVILPEKFCWTCCSRFKGVTVPSISGEGWNDLPGFRLERQESGFEEESKQEAEVDIGENAEEDLEKELDAEKRIVRLRGLNTFFIY